MSDELKPARVADVDWVKNGIADFIADNWMDGREYTISDIVAGLRAIEINPPRAPIPQSPGSGDGVVAALQAARDCIWTDRVALADCHTGPDGLDEDGAAGVADYDEVIAQIDAALLAASPLPDREQA